MLGKNTRLKILDQIPPMEDEATSPALRFLDMPDEPHRTSFGLLGGEGENAGVREVLERIIQGLDEAETRHARIDLAGLEANERTLLEELLGEGEVRAIVWSADSEYRIQESVLPGVWKIRRRDAEGRATGEYVEVSDVPQVVRDAEARTDDALSLPDRAPEGAMNVMPVLSEIQHAMRTHRGEENHIISFTLMPMTPVDMEVLERALGTGPIVAESKGYGTCRVQLTGRRNVWSVQHMNVMGDVILDTLEIGRVPIALLAAKEDFEDSAIRIRELLEDDL